MKSIRTYFPGALLFFSICAGCNPAEDDTVKSPTIISGQVKDENGAAVANAKISLLTDPAFESKLTDAGGFFYLTGFSAVKHRIRIEKIGFENYDADVPDPINGTSTMNPVMKRKTYNVPAMKPLSTGVVRINNKKLEADFDRNGTYEEFVVKGVAFSPAPIGGKPWTKEVYDRSILWLKNLNANTARTYSGVDKYFLQQAGKNDIRVIVSFWVNLDLDLSVSEVRQTIIDDFATMVLDLKEYPGVLMWNIGNEQNYSSAPNNGNSPYWYSLAQEMAVAAYKVEGEMFHPVCVSNGNLYNIGSTAMNANDASLTYIDLWASNAYEQNFTSFFSSYRTKSAKPIVITEFGIDALNDISKTEHEPVQAYFDSTNWAQIRSASDVCIGATVFEFTDEWWKAGDANSHDFGGYPTNAHPDGYSNEEWWGIIAVTPDADNDGLDEWRARKAYEMFQRNWK
ncbi:MAG: carboxypeptidase regulatory-like domain-containing protein [Ignavibacteriales bacterium]|nr:carboxypeptidase regulatory-like domain-containing protein [Ignavibacteriales bacterium]